MNSTALWYTTRASGIMTLILLTATMVLGLVTVTRAKGRNWPGFVQQELHRRISIMAMVFLAIHVLTSVLDTYVHIGWVAIVVPFTSPYRVSGLESVPSRSTSWPPCSSRVFSALASPSEPGEASTGSPTPAGRSHWRTRSAWVPMPGSIGPLPSVQVASSPWGWVSSGASA